MNRAAKIFGTSSQEYYKAYSNYMQIQKAFQESAAAVYELRDALFENARAVKEQVVDKWERVLDRISAARDYYSARPDSIKTQDANIIQTYVDENARTQEKINALNASIGTYRNQMQYFNASSKQYQELADKVNSAEVEIMNLGTGMYKNLSEVFDMYTNRFDQSVEKLGTAIEEAGSIVDLLGEESFVDKAGNITANGQAGIMLYGTMINKNTDAMEDWRHAIDEVNNAYNAGRISEEKRNELVSEYTKNIQDAVAKNKDYANSLTEIYKKQLENENNVLQDNINKRKEALQAKEDYYNYDRQLRDSNKDIQSLEAQIAALENTSSAAGQARLLQLREQLRQARESREDMERGHRNELLQSGYDSLSQNAQTALDDTLSALETNSTFQQQIVSNMLDNIVANYATAYGTIANIIEGTGDVISSTLQSALSVTASSASEASRVANRAKQTVDTNDGLGTGGYNNNQIENSTGNRTLSNAMNSANLSGTALNTVNAMAKDAANSANEGVGGAAIKRIYATATSSTNVKVQVGKSQTVTIKDGNVITVYDAELVTFSVAKDKKSVTFTGKKAGSEAVVIATDNGSITVSITVTNPPAPKKTTTTPKKSTSSNSASVAYFKADAAKNWSIVDALMRSGGYSYEQVKSPSGIRKQIAAANGISNYTGTASQNEQLVRLIRAGKLINPFASKSSSSSSSSGSYYPATAPRNGSIADTLNSISSGAGSYSYRKKIAAANGISNYRGTAAQNIQMLDLLKRGKLLKPRKKGGIIDSIIPLANLQGGDDGLITAQLGEAVLPKAFMQDVVPEFMKTVKQTTALLQPLGGNGGEVNVHYDSLLTVNGNVDKDALPGLRDLLQQSYEYTSQKMYKDLSKLGFR